MRPEAKFWLVVRKYLPGHVIRVENCVGFGTPDVNVAHDGREVWIELKIYEGGYKIRKAQYVWGVLRHRSGGHVYVLGYNPKSDDVHLYKYPVKVKEYNEKYWMLDDTPISACELRHLRAYILPHIFPNL